MAKELHRQSHIGLALTEVLDEMVEQRLFSPQVKSRILDKFDDVIIAALSKESRPKLVMKGDLMFYRLVDNVWQFDLRNVLLRETKKKKKIYVGRLKIVAVDAKLIRTTSTGVAKLTKKRYGSRKKVGQ